MAVAIGRAGGDCSSRAVDSACRVGCDAVEEGVAAVEGSAGRVWWRVVVFCSLESEEALAVVLPCFTFAVAFT